LPTAKLRQAAGVAIAILVLTFLAVYLGVVTGGCGDPPGECRETVEDQADITGRVTAKESGMPLLYGTVKVGDQEVLIKNGEFELRNLVPGSYEVTITGPYRIPLTKQIHIQAGDSKQEFSVAPQFRSSEIRLLARITRAEAEGESLCGQTAVAATILNRVKSGRYPATISEVVYQRESGRYQYSPVADGRIKLPPTKTSWQAAYRALAGADPSQGATGFYNPARTRDRWVRSRLVTTRLGGHVFFCY